MSFAKVASTLAVLGLLIGCVAGQLPARWTLSGGFDICDLDRESGTLACAASNIVKFYDSTGNLVAQGDLGSGYGSPWLLSYGGEDSLAIVSDPDTGDTAFYAVDLTNPSDCLTLLSSVAGVIHSLHVVSPGYVFAGLNIPNIFGSFFQFDITDVEVPIYSQTGVFVSAISTHTGYVVCYSESAVSIFSLSGGVADALVLDNHAHAITSSGIFLFAQSAGDYGFVATTDSAVLFEFASDGTSVVSSTDLGAVSGGLYDGSGLGYMFVADFASTPFATLYTIPGPTSDATETRTSTSEAQYAVLDTVGELLYVVLSDGDIEVLGASLDTDWASGGGSGSGGGDPHFVGLNGVHFLFHGLSGHSYALISSPNVAVNVVFDGVIGDAEGLFITEFGFMVGDHRVHIDRTGDVTINDVAIDHALLKYDETYVGCMEPVEGMQVTDTPVDSVAACQLTCAERGFALAAVMHAGGNCACMDSDAPFRLLPKAWCADRCAVDGMLCGSKASDGGMSVYESVPRSEVLSVSASDYQYPRKFLWTTEQPAQVTRTVTVETGIFSLKIMVEANGDDYNLNFAFESKDQLRTQLMDGVLGQTGQHKYYPSIFEHLRPEPVVASNSTEVGGGGRTTDPVEFMKSYPLRGSDPSDYETKDIFSADFYYVMHAR